MYSVHITYALVGHAHTVKKKFLEINQSYNNNDNNHQLITVDHHPSIRPIKLFRWFGAATAAAAAVIFNGNEGLTVR